MALKRFGKHCSLFGHGLAIALAVCGLGMIILAPLHLTVYGIALFGLAIALDVIVAVNCADSPTGIRRMCHPRLDHLHVHTRKHRRIAAS